LGFELGRGNGVEKRKCNTHARQQKQLENGDRRKENVEWRTENGEDLEWQDKNEKGQTQNVNGLFTN